MVTLSADCKQLHLRKVSVIQHHCKRYNILTQDIYVKRVQKTITGKATYPLDYIYSPKQQINIVHCGFYLVKNGTKNL